MKKIPKKTPDLILSKSRRMMLKAIPLSIAAPSLIFENQNIAIAGQDITIRSGVGGALFDDLAFLQVSEGAAAWSIFTSLVGTALSQVPVAGAFLSILSSAFLPKLGSDPGKQWQLFVKQIDSVMDQKIENAFYSLLRADAMGLVEAAQNYVQAFSPRARNLTDRGGYLISLETVLATSIPRFQMRGYESQFLPLFAPIASIYLGTLREIILHGKEYGFSGGVISAKKTLIKKKISEYEAYVEGAINSKIEDIIKNNQGGGGYPRSEPMSKMLDYGNKMQVLCRDISDKWLYFDPDNNRGGLVVTVDRELFSPLIGSYFDGRLPSALPKQQPPNGEIKDIAVRSWEFVDGITFSYPQNGGPNKATAIDIGGPGGRSEPFNASLLPIEKITAYYGDAVHRLDFVPITGGTYTFGRLRDDNKSSTTSFKDHILSSVMGFGRANGYGGVLSGCIFGFQLRSKRIPFNPDLQGHLDAVLPPGIVARSS